MRILREFLNALRQMPRLALATILVFIALLWPRIRTVNPTWPTNLPVARGRQPPPP